MPFEQNEWGNNHLLRYVGVLELVGELERNNFDLRLCTLKVAPSPPRIAHNRGKPNFSCVGRSGVGKLAILGQMNGMRARLAVRLLDRATMMKSAIGVKTPCHVSYVTNLSVCPVECRVRSPIGRPLDATRRRVRFRAIALRIALELLGLVVTLLNINLGVRMAPLLGRALAVVDGLLMVALAVAELRWGNRKLEAGLHKRKDVPTDRRELMDQTVELHAVLVVQLPNLGPNLSVALEELVEIRCPERRIPWALLVEREELGVQLLKIQEMNGLRHG